MAVKVTTRFDIINQLEDLNSRDVQEQVATETIDLIKDFTSKGISSLKGEARFDNYKDPSTYPGNRKEQRPVNLFLTGDMLAALTFWLSSKVLTIGFRSGKESNKALAHNQGTDNMARRAFIPMNDGEEFNLTITRRIRDIYSNALAVIIKKAGR